MERDLIDDCVHCGFCLPHCPTYQNWAEEMDSPRGRIDLMRGVREGKTQLTDTTVRHFDQCLGCMACVTACPSGVRYDVLIEETRAHIERHHRRGLRDRLFRSMIFAMFPYPKRLKAIAWTLFAYSRLGLRALMRKLLPRRLAQLDALMPPISIEVLRAKLPERVAPQGQPRAKVALVAGCVQRVFFPGVNEATLRVLAAEGCEVVVPRAQGCCGALSMHAGREDESLRFARDLIATMPPDVDAIIINAAGCGSHLKDYARLLKDDPRAKVFSAKVKDVNEFLASLAPRAPRHPLQGSVAMHDACHLAHAQRIRREPRALLAAIPGLELREVPDSEQCCGSAGVYNLLQPDSADQIGARKAKNVLATGAQVLCSANPGCTLQIEKMIGGKLKALHPVEILDLSIRGEKLP